MLSPFQAEILRAIDRHGFPLATLAVSKTVPRFVGDETSWKEALDELAVHGYIEMTYNEELPIREPKGWVLTQRGRKQMRAWRDKLGGPSHGEDV